MKLDQSAAAAARLYHQLRMDPAAVARAIVWRGLRRPWMRWRQALSRAGANALLPTVIRRELGWARALLDTASLVPPEVARLIMGGPCTVFGRCWSAPGETLAALDARFGVEVWRLQHLQALAVFHWRSDPDPGVFWVSSRSQPQRLDEILRVELRSAVTPRRPADAPTRLDVEQSIRLYPMDHGLRALSVLIAYASLQAEGSCAHSAREDDGLAAALGASIQNTIDICLSDPEYSGALSNNHHLTTVVCLLVMLASVQPLGGRNAHKEVSADRNFAKVMGWLLRALEEQFDGDGVHFEYSSGYHMCTLELLSLAGLIIVDAYEPLQSISQRTPGQRWLSLQTICPALAARLDAALRYADSLTRPDGTYPLIGDFDASRILRTHVTYQNAFDRDRGLGGGTSAVERYRTMETSSVKRRLEAIPLEVPDASSAAALTRALFAVPGPAREPQKRSAPNVLEQVRLKRELDREDMELLASALQIAAGEVRYCVRYAFPLPRAEHLLRLQQFSEAGLIVASNDSLLVTLRSGKPGQNGVGTHSHLDHLSSDVWIANGIRVADPGSWCYGASPELRNRYRANTGHFSPLWQLCWSRVLRHPFFIDQPARPARLAHHSTACWGVMDMAEGWICRVITVRDSQLVIIDASDCVDLVPCPFDELPEPADGYFGPLLRESLTPAGASCAV
jgi:hypothetical protein